MDDPKAPAGVAEGWQEYLRGLAALALPVDAPAPDGTVPGEAVAAEAVAWACQGPWPSLALFSKEPTRVLVVAGSAGPDSDLSRLVALRLAGDFLQGKPAAPFPLRITLRGRPAGEDAAGLLTRHVSQVGMRRPDWHLIEAPTLAVVDGLDDLFPLDAPLPCTHTPLLEDMCSAYFGEFAGSRILLVTRRQFDGSRGWQFILDALDSHKRISVLDAAPSARPAPPRLAVPHRRQPQASLHRPPDAPGDDEAAFGL